MSNKTDYAYSERGYLCGECYLRSHGGSSCPACGHGELNLLSSVEAKRALERLRKIRKGGAPRQPTSRLRQLGIPLGVSLIGTSLWFIVIAIESARRGTIDFGTLLPLVLVLSFIGAPLAGVGLDGPPGRPSRRNRSDNNPWMRRWLRERRKLVPRVVLRPMVSLAVLLGLAALHSWALVSFTEVPTLYALLYGLPAAVSSLFWLVAMAFVLETSVTSVSLAFCMFLAALLGVVFVAFTGWEYLHGSAAAGKTLLKSVAFFLVLPPMVFVLDWMRALSAMLVNRLSPRGELPEMRPRVEHPPNLSPVRGVLLARNSPDDASPTNSAESPLCIGIFGRTELGWIADASCTPMTLRTDDGVEMAIDTNRVAICGPKGRSTDEAGIAALETIGLHGPFDSFVVQDLRAGDRVEVLGTIEESTHASGYRGSTAVALIRGEPVFIKHDGS